MSLPLDVRILIAPEDRQAALIGDVRDGLTRYPKSLPPSWFYDEAGSALFEEITQLAEYYPTRAERSILEHFAMDIVGVAQADTLVEIGAGASQKTRLLLDAMAASGGLTRFVPFDVSEGTLRAAASAIEQEYGISVTGVVGDFHRHLSAIPRDGRRLITFLGGTIGNLNPQERRRFLFDLEATMGHDEWLLLGTDLEKDHARLVEAYDDSKGVTAAFNLNVLQVLNRELGADFDLTGFDHVAVWNDEDKWMEMRLRSRLPQVVTLKAVDLTVTFDQDEDLLTEISAKFVRDGVLAELRAANFVIEETWTDAAGDFLVTLARPYC